MMSAPVIAASDLSIGYRLGGGKEKRVHQHLDFILRPGELTCLLGPNGAGKSTLLRTISGVQRPLAGSLVLEAREMAAYDEKEISRKIGLVLTDKTMAGGLTVGELVALGRHPHTGFWGRMKAEDNKAVEEALMVVGMEAKTNQYVAELSDGERQKVMIARVLAQECPVLLLDEPTAFLDVVSRIEIMNLLHDLAVREKKTILLSTHDLEQALLLGDRLWLLSREKGLCCGITEDLVFAGEIERYFSRNAIRFDRATGSFRPVPAEGGNIRVEAEEEILFWTRNLLIRHGFRESEKGTVCLKIKSPVDMVLLIPGQESYCFASFEALDSFLKHFRTDLLPA